MATLRQLKTAPKPPPHSGFPDHVEPPQPGSAVNGHGAKFDDQNLMSNFQEEIQLQVRIEVAVLEPVLSKSVPSTHLSAACAREMHAEPVLYSTIVTTTCHYIIIRLKLEEVDLQLVFIRT